MNTNILRNLSYGVYIITTMDNDRPTGCVANSAMQITSSPATVAVSINHDNYTNKCIDESGLFAISILAEDSDSTLIGTFGFQSGKTVNKFENVQYAMKSDVPVLEQTNGYIVCKVVDKFETATHTLFLGEMIDGDITSGGNAMTYSYYHTVVKGKSPKNAPTYIPEPEPTSEKATYVCSICGYVYDGEVPFEQLPDDYVCPICKHPKSDFVKK